MACFLYSRIVAARMFAHEWHVRTSPVGSCPDPIAHSAWAALGEAPSIAEVEALISHRFSHQCQHCFREQETLVFFGEGEPTMSLCRDCLLEGLALFSA